jgi:hypothetical protein
MGESHSWSSAFSLPKVHTGLTEVSSRRNLISSLIPLVDKVLYARVLLLSPSLNHLTFKIYLPVIPAFVGMAVYPPAMTALREGAARRHIAEFSS